MGTITVTARTAADMTGIDQISVTARLDLLTPSGEATLAEDSAGLVVDNAGPVVRINLPTNATMQSGPRLVGGTASDRTGVGYVEVRVDDGPWRVAPATIGGIFTNLAWEIGIDAPLSGTFVIQARGHDIFGQTGATVSTIVLVDNVPPTVAVGLASTVLNGTSETLRGTMRDPFPIGGSISRAEIQIDNGVWQPVPPPFPPAGAGGLEWRFTWRLPVEEGVTHTLRVRATDAAGNLGQSSPPVTVTVDSVNPVSSMVYPTVGVTVPETCLTLPAHHILMWGYATDGWGFGSVQVSVNGGQAWADARLGQEAAALLAQVLCAGDNKATGVEASQQLWAVVMPAPYGELPLRYRAIDRAGNVEALKPPVRVQHVAPQVTATPTPSSTPRATATTVTVTSTATPTVTEAPATSTPTPTATDLPATPTSTVTEVPATSTPTPTATSVSTTPTATATSVPNTATPTPTVVPITPTRTPTATVTPTSPPPVYRLFWPHVPHGVPGVRP
jgi:hypothetical protein